MKQLIVLLCVALIACSGAQSQKPPDNDIKTTACPEDYIKILKMETDDSDWSVVWVDGDCDDICDFATIVTPDGQPYIFISCEDADALWKEAEKLMKGTTDV